MSIWSQIFGTTPGGWRTYGPNVAAGFSGFGDSGTGGIRDSITAEQAMRLAAVWACMNIRAEAIGALPIHIRSRDKKILYDHPLYNVLHSSPNSMMTGPEYQSLTTAHMDIYGNEVSLIRRRTRDKSVISLEPLNPTECQKKPLRDGSGWYWEINGENHDDSEILHVPSFTINAGWGQPRIDIGRSILASQLTANVSAIRAFQQGLKVGGFFEVEKSLDSSELIEFNNRLNNYGLPENQGKWMTLLKGMKPIGGADFRVKPAEAELLMSRYFGIEEICRLFNTPPMLIGHSDKASSWASSLEQLNLFFQVYSLMPTYNRKEARYEKKLLSNEDRANGIQIKFVPEGIHRADLKTRQAFYASGLQNGYLSQNDVLAMEDRPGIGPEGDVYRVQLNMANADDPAAGDGGDNKEPKK